MTLPVDLNGDRSAVRSSQTNLTSLVTDVILENTKADVVFISSGSIRESLFKGPVTEEDIYNVMPFGDVIVTVQLSGKELLEALEHGLGQYPKLVESFPQLARILVSVDYGKPSGHRVQSVLINEKTLQPDELYTVATSTYLVSGGDGYTQFQKPITRSFGKQKDMFIAILKEKTSDPNTDWSTTSRIIDK